MSSASASNNPTRRSGLVLADEDAVIAEIRELRRRGHARTGSWTLEQICWHLDAATKARMQPGPFAADTPEQAARKAVVPEILATKRLPTGINAPDAFVPPQQADDSAIDACIATLERFKAFPGPIAPHRVFGRLTDDDARRLTIIHCAHHLSFLVPNP